MPNTPTVQSASHVSKDLFVFTFFGFLFFQFLLLVLDGFHLCVVDLSQLVPVRSVVVQAIKHGLDLFVEPGELLMNDGQNTGTSVSFTVKCTALTTMGRRNLGDPRTSF